MRQENDVKRALLGRKPSSDFFHFVFHALHKLEFALWSLKKGISTSTESYILGGCFKCFEEVDWKSLINIFMKIVHSLSAYHLVERIFSMR